MSVPEKRGKHDHAVESEEMRSMALFSIQKAADKLGVPVRTLYGWIDTGAVKTTEMINGRQGISESEIMRVSEKMSSERRQRKQGPDLEKRVAALESESLSASADLEERLADIERRVAHLEEAIEAALAEKLLPLSPLALPADKAIARVRSIEEELPEGTITLIQFAESVGLKRSTISQHLSDGHYVDTVVISAGGQRKHYFTPKQAEVARKWHRRE